MTRSPGASISPLSEERSRDGACSGPIESEASTSARFRFARRISALGAGCASTEWSKCPGGAAHALQGDLRRSAPGRNADPKVGSLASDLGVLGGELREVIGLRVLATDQLPDSAHVSR